MTTDQFTPTKRTGDALTALIVVLGITCMLLVGALVGMAERDSLLTLRDAASGRARAGVVGV